MFHLAMPLDIVLSSHEVPQEVAPVHEVYLIGDEEAQVLGKGGQIPFLPDSTHPILIGLGMPPRVHTGKKHIFFIQIFDVVTNHLVFLFSRISRGTVNSLSFLVLRNQILTFGFTVQFAAICRAVKERSISILFAVQIAAQGENVAWCILTHRRIGIGADKDNAITAISCQYHHDAGQRQFKYPPFYLIIGYNDRRCQQDDVYDESCVVGATQQVGK